MKRWNWVEERASRRFVRRLAVNKRSRFYEWRIQTRISPGSRFAQKQ